VTAALVLAVKDSNVNPGVLGFLVVAALGVATWLLIRSMNRQMRRIDLPDERAEAEGSPGVGSDEVGDGERDQGGGAPGSDDR
jgi:hypothetical protein